MGLKNGTKVLAGSDVGELREALIEAFPKPSDLRAMVKIQLDRNLDQITEGPLNQRAFELIQAAEAEGWTAELVEGAHAENPGNPALKAFYLRFTCSVQRSVGKPEVDKLERLVTGGGTFDIVGWREKLGQIEHQVCRVEIRNSPAGTGFLVAKDLVLTNYHVVNGRALEDVTVRFDHKVLSDGTTIQNGTIYRVKDPLVAQSPFGAEENKVPPPRPPSTGELDYALLQIDGSPGDDAIEGKPRGFLVPAKDPAPSKGIAFIIHHPLGQPLKVSFDEILQMNEGRTRVTYRTDTERGSSGAPGFDREWNLILLHHSGDPDFKHQAEYNEGIPFDTIRANLPEGAKKRLAW